MKIAKDNADTAQKKIFELWGIQNADLFQKIYLEYQKIQKCDLINWKFLSTEANFYWKR